MTGPFVAGMIAGYGVAIPVGAIAVLVAGLAARTGLRTGVAAALGAATADGLYAAAAVLGGAALTVFITPLATPLRWAAAVVLLLLAAWTACSAGSPSLSPAGPPASSTAGSDSAPPARPRGACSRSSNPARWRRGPATAYLSVLGLTLLNPATVVYFAALVVGRGGTGGGAWFVAGAFFASATWQLLIAVTGALAGRTLTSPRAQRLSTLTSSAVIAALAIGLLL